jgi:hypothetical protein
MRGKVLVLCEPKLVTREMRTSIAANESTQLPQDGVTGQSPDRDWEVPSTELRSYVNTNSDRRQGELDCAAKKNW